ARWGAILRAMGHRVPFARRFEIIMGTWPIASVTPSKAGDVLRARPLRERIPAVETVGSVLAERVVDVLVLSGVWLLGASVAGMWKMAVLAGCILAGAVAGLIVLGGDFRGIGRSLLGAKFQGLLTAFRALGRRPKMLALAVLWSGLNWFLSVLQVKYLLLALGGSIGIVEVMASLPPALFVGLLPFTIAGMGTRDAAVVALFASYGAPHQLLGMSLLYTFLGYWLFALVGLAFTRKVL
ncbi:MAG: YbhN family protein, partial [Nitrospinota bacterium]